MKKSKPKNKGDFTFEILNLDLFFTNNTSILNNLFSTQNWIFFLQKSNAILPLGLDIFHNTNFIGRIFGGVFKKAGIKIFGSPFKGWSTQNLGFIFLDQKYYENDYFIQILESLRLYLRKIHKVQYSEIADTNFYYNSEKKYRKYVFIEENSIILDIDKEETLLFNSFKTDVRTNVRKFEKNNGFITIATNIDEFIDYYYTHLIEIFQKQGLKPFYSEKKVKLLLESCYPNNALLLLAHDNQKKIIASSIYLFFDDVAYFWGNSSNRESLLNFRPNEALMWFAIVELKKRGVKTLDLYGERPYKFKYNPSIKKYSRVLISSIPFLILARNIAKKLFYFFKKTKKG